MKKNDDIDTLTYETTPPKKRLRASDMRAWLTQYKVNTRSSTVTNAFVAALLPHDEYHERSVESAMVELDQNVDKLHCVYCKGSANTWDHLTNLVQGRKANGHGHRIHNLVPCCSTCNSSKGRKSFSDWILGYQHKKNGWVEGTDRVKGDRKELVESLILYQQKCPPRSEKDLELEAELMAMRDCVLAILEKADKLVAEARPPKAKGGKPARKRSSDTPSIVTKGSARKSRRSEQ